MECSVIVWPGLNMNILLDILYQKKRRKFHFDICGLHCPYFSLLLCGSKFMLLEFILFLLFLHFERGVSAFILLMFFFVYSPSTNVSPTPTLSYVFMDRCTGALAFDVEYARWLEEHNRKINELRAAVNSHAGDTELRSIVDNVTAHFDDIFRLKGIAAKADVFHILSGMWKTPAERCFLWIGGFRSSELLKVSSSHHIQRDCCYGSH